MLEFTFIIVIGLLSFGFFRLKRENFELIRENEELNAQNEEYSNKLVEILKIIEK